ncbi:MAG: 4Fe-4S ferredoxin [Oscillospiraceae bacterium]|nr:4Fe-4S ferredoxin [Oscillospiraceae bacterium]
MVHKHSRHVIQLISAVLTNGYFSGFASGSIYKGPLKSFCVPTLNCYSCPGALGSCPIGALQAVLGGNRSNVSYYVTGLLILFGVLLGRLICGFLCLFGLIQDLLYRIPTPKCKLPRVLDRPLRRLKYLVLLILVLLLPVCATNSFGIAPPYFCKYLCPAGTLEGGIPLVLAEESLKAMLGWLFAWKLFLLLAFLLASVFLYRPFCKYICPLGAIYSLFNRFSFYQMHVDRTKCVGCHTCRDKCNMGVDPLKNINSGECIRCGECGAACPTQAISGSFLQKKPSAASRNTSPLA